MRVAHLHGDGGADAEIVDQAVGADLLHNKARFGLGFRRLGGILLLKFFKQWIGIHSELPAGAVFGSSWQAEPRRKRQGNE